MPATDESSKSTSKEYRGYIGGIVIAIVAILANVAITWINNSNQLSIKKFEVTYDEKRNVYTDFIRKYEAINSAMTSYILGLHKSDDLIGIKNRMIDSIVGDLKGSSLLQHEDQNPDTLFLDIARQLNEMKNTSMMIEPFLKANERMVLHNRTLNYYQVVIELINKYEAKSRMRSINSTLSEVEKVSMIKKYEYLKKYDLSKIEDTIKVPKYMSEYYSDYVTVDYEDYFVIILWNQLFVE